MLHGMHTKTAFNQLKSEGWQFLYRGILPPLCQKTISVSLMFGMYSHYQQVLTRVFPHANKHAKQTTAAMLAGLTEAVLTPFERVQMLLQDRHYHQRFKNTAHAFVELHQFGMKEYFRGLTPILLPKAEHWSGKLLSDFCCGAMVGAIISTIFYPINIVKTHMQCKIGGPFNSLSKTMQIVYVERDRSLRKMFYGVHVNYTRALISWGIINASYELLWNLMKHQEKHTYQSW